MRSEILKTVNITCAFVECDVTYSDTCMYQNTWS